MKTRKLINKKLVIIAIGFLMISTVVFGNEGKQILTDLILPQNEMSIEELQVRDKKNFGKNERALERITKNYIKNTPMNYDEYNQILSYSVFLAENEFTDEQIEYLNSLIDSGYSEGVIQEVYEFWLTTDEDFSMIGDLCALSNEMYGIYWVENAFNKLTNNSHGVLNREEIESYYEQGLTHDDIYTANILSRKKGQTIQGILDDMLSGKDMSDIMNDTGRMPKNKKARVRINTVSPSVALKVAECSEMDMSDIPENEEEIIGYITAMEDERYSSNVRMAKAKLKDMGIEPEQIDRDKRKKETKQSRENAMRNGFDTHLITSFLRRGYTYEQIEKASEVYCTENINELEAIKKITEGAER